MGDKQALEQFHIEEQPNYIAQGDEEEIFACAFRLRIPLIVKGPTGCGKTRFIDYMAYSLDMPLITVSCHEDLTASDLTGRFLFEGNRTAWQDGPLTLAVRHGAICYLDEIVEARKDTTVVIHSLTDYRRSLYVDRTSEVIHADPHFMLVLSYNPGYQSIVKDLKQSTKQRFASLVFSYPSVDTETLIIHTESGLPMEQSRRLAEMGAKVRELQRYGPDEGVSTRLLVYAARLMQAGIDPMAACTHALSQTLTDDSELRASIENVAKVYFGDLMEQPTRNGAER